MTKLDADHFKMNATIAEQLCRFLTIIPRGRLKLEDYELQALAHYLRKTSDPSEKVVQPLTLHSRTYLYTYVSSLLKKRELAVPHNICQSWCLAYFVTRNKIKYEEIDSKVVRQLFQIIFEKEPAQGEQNKLKSRLKTKAVEKAIMSAMNNRIFLFPFDQIPEKEVQNAMKNWFQINLPIASVRSCSASSISYWSPLPSPYHDIISSSNEVISLADKAHCNFPSIPTETVNNALKHNIL